MMVHFKRSFTPALLFLSTPSPSLTIIWKVSLRQPLSKIIFTLVKPSLVQLLAHRMALFSLTPHDVNNRCKNPLTGKNVM